MADCDFSDMADFKVGKPVTLPKDGMPTERLCMSHVVYDRERDRYFMAGEMGWDGKVRCCQQIPVASLDAKSFNRGEGEWETHAVIDKSLTGKYGNHNAALGRDPYGRLWRPDRLDLALSTGDQSFIWSFTIGEMTLAIKD